MGLYPNYYWLWSNETIALKNWKNKFYKDQHKVYLNYMKI